ncbi:MAG TPA: COX15/CtaA family protein [Planctomycetota bacterium]|nr:COX15/CtaA family protein [Planctomycetota bacterium]
MSQFSENKAPLIETTPAVGTYHRAINVMAKMTAVWAFLVICLGGLTKSKEAGLTIAEPIYYKFNWEWFFVENLNAEYTHRTFVAILSGLTLLTAGLVFWKDKRRSVNRLAGGMLLGLLAQAVLGAMTVAYFAKAKTSIPHAALGQVFFCMAVAMCVVTSKRWIESGTALRSRENPALSKLALWTVIAMFVQLLLGAALRHDDQAQAMREGRFGIFAWHLTAHMLGAFAVVYFVSRVLFRVFRDHRSQPEILKPARLIMMLLGVQILLGFGAGVLKVITLDEAHSPPPLRVLVATTHLAVGALIFAAGVTLALRTHRFILSAPAVEEQADRAKLAGVTA